MSRPTLAKVTGAEERFRLLLEAAPEAIVVTKRDGRIVGVNTQTERLFGYHREELFGQNVEVLLPQHVRHRHVKKRAAYFSHPRVRRMGKRLELNARRKDGTEFPVEVSFSPLETGGETLVSGFIRDITEGKRSEELISHLAAIVETSDDAIIGESLDGTILSWNSGAERLYGYKAEEMVGRPLALLVPPRRTDEMARFMKAIRHGERVEHYETTRLHKDGHPIEISVTISPVKDRAGTVIGASVIARDITERTRADQLAAYLASIVEASDDAIIGKSLDGTIISWNSGAERLYGYTAEEVVGRPVALLVPPDRADELEWIMTRLIRGKRIEHYETTRVHKDGHRIEVSVTVSPVKNKAGAVVGASAIARDITDRKRVEMTLRQSEERFRVALTNAPVVVFNQDCELRYTWINSPVLAWANQDYLGRTDAEIVGGEEGARLTAIKQEVLRSGRGTRTEVEVHFQGETHYFDLTVEPLRDDKGDVVGITCAAGDVTPLKQAAVELEHLNQLKNEFLGMAAHDLLNPIATILFLAGQLGDEVASVLTEEQLEYVSQIRSSSKFMVQLIEDFLDISSIESGRLYLDRRESDPRKLLEHNVGLNAKLARQKHIHVGLQIEGALPILSLDERKIEQVLNNLISNAVKFSQPGTTVQVRAAAQDGGVLISVHDQGPGISEAERVKLFQPFGRTSALSTGGEVSTGLGLAIARKIVDGHGGQIWVKSQVGVGSAFLFTLPAYLHTPGIAKDEPKRGQFDALRRQPLRGIPWTSHGGDNTSGGRPSTRQAKREVHSEQPKSTDSA